MHKAPSQALVGFLALSVLTALSACSAGSSSKGGSGGAGAVQGSGSAENGGAATGGAPGGGGTSPGGAGGASGSGGSTDTDALFGTDPARNNVPRGQVCDRVATIQCASEQKCCSSPGRTFDECKSVMKQGCIDSLMDAVTSNPVSGYDPNAAEPLFAQFEDKAKTCDPGVAGWAASPTGLRGIVAGTVDPGGNCTPPIGEITTKEYDAAYLASCKDPANTACLPHPVPQPWTCAPRVDVGGTCFTDVNCVEGLYCDNYPQLSLSGGPCKARKQVGESCITANQCASLHCKAGACVEENVQNAYCLTN